jgi:hypothetical protein
VAKITFTISDTHINRVTDALAKRFSYQASDGPKGDFVKEQLALLLRRMVSKQEAKDAAATALDAVEDADIT